MTPAEVVAREMEHQRCRAARTHVKVQRTRMLVIGQLQLQTFYDPADFPGFTREQIEAGLTVPAALDSKP